jgi:hypothetical protein
VLVRDGCGLPFALANVTVNVMPAFSSHVPSMKPIVVAIDAGDPGTSDHELIDVGLVAERRAPSVPPVSALGAAAVCANTRLANDSTSSRAACRDGAVFQATRFTPSVR